MDAVRNGESDAGPVQLITSVPVIENWASVLVRRFNFDKDEETAWLLHDYALEGPLTVEDCDAKSQCLNGKTAGFGISQFDDERPIWGRQPPGRKAPHFSHPALFDGFPKAAAPEAGT